jgi:hypothetical protein
MFDRKQHVTRIKIPALDTLASLYRQELYLLHRLFDRDPMHGQETMGEFNAIRKQVLELEQEMVWSDPEGLEIASKRAASLANKEAEYHASVNLDHPSITDYIGALATWRKDLLVRCEELAPVQWGRLEHVITIH